jgi:hypothetical protein
MPDVEYRILFYTGQETIGKAQMPDAETDPEGKERWRIAREIVMDVIGQDADPEHVTVWYDGRYLDMFVDETGVLKALPYNNVATTIYRANTLAHEPDPGPVDELPYIAGSAVLFLDKVWKWP